MLTYNLRLQNITNYNYHNVQYCQRCCHSYITKNQAYCRPSSAEAIKASHENLRLVARKAQRTFGSGFLNAGYLAACVRDDFAYKRSEVYMTKPAWEPVFEPDAAMLSGIGDGVGKINQAIPGYIGPGNMQDLTGIKPEG